MVDRNGIKNRFVASRKQLQRIWRISAMLKRREWVKMREILRAFDETEFEEGAYLACGRRTIQRDIRILKEEYGAPVEYSKRQCAYRLTDRDWSLQLPVLLSEDDLRAIVANDGAAKDLFPEAISRRIGQVVDKVLQDNSVEPVAAELSASLRVLSHAAVPPDIFQAIFEAWSKCLVVQIRYADRDGNVLTRDIEPHVLVFYESMWSIKGFCRLRRDVRIFHLGRITAAVVKEEKFKRRGDIVNSVTPDSFFGYDRLSNVVLELNGRGRRFAELYPLHSQQSFEQEEDLHRMFVPEVSRELLIPWVLRQQGDARPVEPALAAEAVRDSIRHLADACQAYDPDEIRKKVRKRRAKETHS